METGNKTEFNPNDICSLDVLFSNGVFLPILLTCLGPSQRFFFFLIQKGYHHYGSQRDGTERVWTPGMDKSVSEQGSTSCKVPGCEQIVQALCISFLLTLKCG